MSDPVAGCLWFFVLGRAVPEVVFSGLQVSTIAYQHWSNPQVNFLFCPKAQLMLITLLHLAQSSKEKK